MAIKARNLLYIVFVVIGGQAHADTFHGYYCTDDCSGHEAGYAWAEQNDITNPDDCSGNSQSFIEGCQAWAEENATVPQDDSTEDDSSEDDTTE